MPHVHKPGYVVATIFDIDYEELSRSGVTVLTFDIENTLGLLGCTELDEATNNLLVSLTERFRLCLGTNSGRDFTAMAASFNGLIVQPGGAVRKKGHRSFFEEIVRVTGVAPQKIAMIGDKLLFDTSPANDLGMISVLVTPLGKDLWLETLGGRRRRERRALRRLGVVRPRR